MIQIQDDNMNQSASVPQMPSSQTPSDQSAQPAAQPAQSSAEIDQLLEELDRLSKDLNEKPATNEPSRGYEMPKSDETVSSSTPVTPAEPVVSETTPMADSADTNKNAPASDEKFDFDTFLADLEKKIDQESKQNESAAPSQKAAPAEPAAPAKAPTSDEVIEDFPDSEDFSDDLDVQDSFDNFRKNRPAADLEDDKDDSADRDESTVEPAQSEPNAEELKAQNIFEMLGLTNISDEEKNQFLDELESMIWEDFVVHDLELLLTSEEYAGAREILDKPNREEEKKEALIVYLEKLVPDLDEVLYDKALELKSEMMGERLNKMREGADQAVLDKVKEVEDLISQNRWKSAVSLLNQLS